MSELAAWDSFYVIIGSAAGALIGLQFVVMTLIAQNPLPGSAEADGAFGTPTIVHFSIALLLSAVLRAPWPTVTPAAACAGIVGLCGVIYVAVVLRRIRVQSAYQPELEDWLFHVLLPFVGYAMLAGSAVVTALYTREGLFGVGGGVLLLLFTGIHNAWDSVAFLVFTAQRDRGQNRK